MGEAQVAHGGHDEAHQCHATGQEGQVAEPHLPPLQQTAPLLVAFLLLPRRRFGRGGGAFAAPLTTQQLVGGDAEDLGNDGDEMQLRVALVPLPAADRLVGDVELFPQLLLGHAVGLAQCGDEFTNGLFFHSDRLLFGVRQRSLHPNSPTAGEKSIPSGARMTLGMREWAHARVECSTDGSLV